MTIAGTETRRLADRAVDERRLLAIGMEAEREPAGPLGDVGKRIAGAARLVPWWGFAGVGGLAVPLAIVVAERVGQAKSAGAPVCYAQGADLAGLYFPPGHPRRNVVYVAHPINTERYLPLATFQRVLFEEKAREALEMLAALGAEKIDIRQSSGTKASADLGASLNVPGAAKVAASGARSSHTSSEVVMSARLNPSGPSRLHSHQLWYPHESLWQSVARLRLESGLQEFALTVEHTDDHGVNAKLAATVEGAGLEIGGSYTDFSSVRWEMTGSFNDSPSA